MSADVPVVNLLDVMKNQDELIQYQRRELDELRIENEELKRICSAAVTASVAQVETPKSVALWADATFGASTARRTIERAKQEFDELEATLERPHTARELALEAADVCIVLYRLIGGLYPEAIDAKMTINRHRLWTLDGTGCAQHVEEPQLDPSTNPTDRVQL